MWVASASVLEGEVKVDSCGTPEPQRPPWTFLYLCPNLSLRDCRNPLKQQSATTSTMSGPKGMTTDADIFGSELTGRASSPALSDTSELTVLSRSPSPIPDYQSFPSTMTALPLTPPSTPDRSRAANGRFTTCGVKRANTPDNSRFVHPDDTGSLYVDHCAVRLRNLEAQKSH
jgi:hypothetical protein